MEPSRVGREMLHNARVRVFGRIVRDPVFWVMTAVAIAVGIRALNDGVCMAYDSENSKWFVSSPVMAMLPGSVAGVGYRQFAAVVAIVVLLQGVRNALGRAARGAFLLISSLLSGIGAVAMSLMLSQDSPFAVQSTKCDLSDPSFIGSVFGVYLSFAVSALSAAQEHKWFMSVPVAMFAVGANAVGLFLFAPPAVSLVYAAVAILVFLYAFIYARVAIGATAEFKFLVFFSLPIVISLIIVSQTVDASIVNRHIEPYLEGGSFVPAGLVETRDLLSTISSKVWQSNPWLGTGIGSFGYDLKFHAGVTDWMIISPVQKAPLNGYWFLLVERGIVGAFIIASVLSLLIVHYFLRMIKSFGARMPQPVVATGLLIIAAAAAESFVTITFLTPGMLIALAAALAISANSFPKGKKNG